MRRSLIASAAAFAAVAITVSLAAPGATARRAASQVNVVFERTTAAGNADVVVTSEEGHPQNNITAGNPGNDASPAFAPGGEAVAFTTDRRGRFELWQMNADGARPRVLTPSGGSDVNPSYSPDGKWVVFACNTNGNWDICIVTSNGTGRHNLTHDSATELDPTWSPDSKQIVFDRIDGHETSDIWTVSPQGGTPTDITPQSPLNELDPTLSKSGWLAFDAVDAKGNYDIYVTEPGSAQATRLTTDSAEDSAPVYSPDGEKLLFVSARKGDYEIYEMNADGSGQRDVSNSPTTADVAPNFAPLPPRAPAAAAHLTVPAGNFPCGPPGPGDNNPNRLCGGTGNDTIHGWGGNDLIDGGPGNDSMFGDDGNDTIYARAGIGPDKDVVWGGKGTDVAFILPGADTWKSDVEYPRTTS
jgi:TolB protein